MKNFVMQMLCSNGKISSKRVITFAAFTVMGLGFIANLFFVFKVEEDYFTSMEYIVIAGLGFTASEKFAGKQTTPKEENTGE